MTRFCNSSKYLVIFIISLCCLSFVSYCDSTERVYFIAAVEVFWDYAPSGRDGLTGLFFNESDAAAAGSMDGGVEHGAMGNNPSMWVTHTSTRYFF